MPRVAKSKGADSSANLGFEATAMRPSANLQCEAKTQSLARQRDPALRDSAIPQSEATPQGLSKAKSKMVALPGHLFFSTQIPVCLWFLAKNKNVGALTHNLN